MPPNCVGWRPDARSHDHREHTEIDGVLECAAGAAVEPDGERVAVGLGGTTTSGIAIRPAARCRTPGVIGTVDLPTNGERPDQGVSSPR